MSIAFYSNNGSANQPEFWPDYWKTVSLEFNPAYVPEYPVLMKQVVPGQRILDVGCGRGVVVRDLGSRGFHVRGIDFDGDSILDSVRCEGHFPADIGDLNHLPYRSDSFDAVLLAGTIEHVFRGPNSGYAEVARVLKPGGSLVLTIPYVNLVRKLAFPFYVSRDMWMARFPETQRKKFFEWVFTRSEVVQALASAGLSVAECKRAYYTTTLRKVPGFIQLSSLLFERGSAPAHASGNGNGSRSQAAPRKSGGKQFLKGVIESSLNMIIANRLLVVARKPLAGE
jgi:SAM-dependent methyltransferase